MTTNQARITHYNGTLWRLAARPDGTQTVKPFRLAGGASAAQGAIRRYRNSAQPRTVQTAAIAAKAPWGSRTTAPVMAAW